jgi:hypothetical protein
LVTGDDLLAVSNQVASFKGRVFGWAIVVWRAEPEREAG